MTTQMNVTVNKYQKKICNCQFTSLEFFRKLPLIVIGFVEVWAFGKMTQFHWTELSLFWLCLQ